MGSAFALSYAEHASRHHPCPAVRHAVALNQNLKITTPQHPRFNLTGLG
jgi:hypothetical protein